LKLELFRFSGILLAAALALPASFPVSASEKT